MYLDTGKGYDSSYIIIAFVMTSASYFAVRPLPILFLKLRSKTEDMIATEAICCYNGAVLLASKHGR
jgi:hypothetical protein